MMNKMPTSATNRLRLLVALPLIAVLLVAFKSIYPVKTDGYTKIGPAIYLKNTSTFKTACWTAPSNLTITPITGTAEVYELDNAQDIAAAYKKYGLYLPDNELYEKVVAKIPGAVQEKRPQVVDEYKDFYSRNPQVRKLLWTSANQIIVRLESTEEIYNLDDKASRAAAEKKYGKLPSTPPPAEVVTREELKARSNKVEQQKRASIFIPEEIEYYKDRSNLPVEYTNFLKKNPSVKKVGWTQQDQIVIFLKTGGTEFYELNDAKSMTTAKSKYGELPGLLPPPPPVSVKEEQLPPPPPPLKYEGPAIPKAGGTRIVENDEYVLYTLWPEEITKRELEVAKQVFEQSGFNLNFQETFKGDKINSLKIELHSNKSNSQVSNNYDATVLKNLLAADNIVLVKGNKKTGEVTLHNTLAPRK